MSPSEPPHLIFTCGFGGFENASLWFAPITGPFDGTLPLLFAQGASARARVSGMLAVGCSMAAQRQPELALALQALGGAVLDLDYFDLPENAPAQGWFRMTAHAPGATQEALEACEKALALGRAPLMAARVDGALRAFGNGSSDGADESFVGAALEATRRVSSAFERAPLDLGSAELIRLSSADGTRRLVAVAPSPRAPSDPLGDMKILTKLAQAFVEAQRAAGPGADHDAFFAALQRGLGGSPESDLPKLHRIGLPEHVFFHAPSALQALCVDDLPSASFEECSKHFLQAVAARFGPLAASSSGFEGPLEGRSLSVVELCAAGSLFSKLPAQAAAAPQGPSIMAAKASAPSPR